MRIFPITTQIKWYCRAAWDYPRGMLCSWCHRPNFFFDDVGWFCIWPDGSEGKSGICCEHCYRGPLGEAHIARHGVGDR